MDGLLCDIGAKLYVQKASCLRDHGPENQGRTQLIRGAEGVKGVLMQKFHILLFYLSDSCQARNYRVVAKKNLNLNPVLR